MLLYSVIFFSSADRRKHFEQFILVRPECFRKTVFRSVKCRKNRISTTRRSGTVDGFWPSSCHRGINTQLLVTGKKKPQIRNSFFGCNGLSSLTAVLDIGCFAKTIISVKPDNTPGNETMPTYRRFEHRRKSNYFLQFQDFFFFFFLGSISDVRVSPIRDHRLSG